MSDLAAAEALELCFAVGVEEFVVCGGARNAELVAMLGSVAEGIRCWNFPEERSAAFFALGRIRATGRPVAVLTTSGTAAAELLPAVIEAHYQALPLIALTADRPERYRGSGAPQAIEQVGIFGCYAETEWCSNRPLHINVPLEAPTAETISNTTLTHDRICPIWDKFCPSDGAAELGEFLAGAEDLVVMLGCVPVDWREGLREFLVRLGAPIYPEATSGLREDQSLVKGDPRAASSVLRIGGVPACREWRDLEDRADVRVFSVAPNGLTGLARGSQVVQAVDWSAVTLPSGGQNIEAVKSEPAALAKGSEQAWLRALSKRIPEGSMVFLGNSLPIREWNRFATFEDRGLRCYANRGANGIDGTVSTFLGMAAEEEEAWLVCGDLTALYDLAAPWVLGQIGEGNRRLVVINNGGGKIFRRLPALAEVGEGTMGLIENPHAHRFEAWAAMWGMAYRQVAEESELDGLPDGPLVIEVVPDTAATEDCWNQLSAP